MGKPAFTPGPWHSGLNGNVYSGHSRFLCSPSAPSVSDQRVDGESWIEMRQRTQPERDAAKLEVVATAHLIAAAPELYEACAEFVRKVDAGEARSTKSYRQMQAALSKARGES